MRYVILRRGRPVHGTNTCASVIAYLWGRDIRNHYVVLDYGRPYPWDNPDLLAWIVPLQEAH